MELESISSGADIALAFLYERKVRGMKGQMIKRAVKLNEIFERRGLSFRVVYDKISVMNGEDKEAYSLESSDYNILPVLYYNREWWAFSDTELADYIELLFLQNAQKISVKRIYPVACTSCVGIQKEYPNVRKRKYCVHALS